MMPMRLKKYATLMEPKRVPVVMCAWKRVHRLPKTLQMLAEQDTTGDALRFEQQPPRSESSRFSSLRQPDSGASNSLHP
jgi:hypothetical protein